MPSVWHTWQLSPHISVHNNEGSLDLEHYQDFCHEEQHKDVTMFMPTWASSTKHQIHSSTSYHSMQPSSQNYVPYVEENPAAKKGGHLVRKEWSWRIDLFRPGSSCMQCPSTFPPLFETGPAWTSTVQSSPAQMICQRTNYKRQISLTSFVLKLIFIGKTNITCANLNRPEPQHNASKPYQSCSHWTADGN
jgi:hypothetical protein